MSLHLRTVQPVSHDLVGRCDLRAIMTNVPSRSNISGRVATKKTSFSVDTCHDLLRLHDDSTCIK